MAYPFFQMTLAITMASSVMSAQAKSQDEFVRLNQLILSTYSDQTTTVGAQLKIEDHWKYDTLNGFARRAGPIWVIEANGGLYRSPWITDDGYLAFLCHEVGHHLGGAPFKPDVSWMSQEGQADYFAASSCLRKL